MKYWLFDVPRSISSYHKKATGGVSPTGRCHLSTYSRQLQPLRQSQFAIASILLPSKAEKRIVHVSVYLYP